MKNKKRNKKIKSTADYLVLIFITIIALVTVLLTGNNKYLVKTTTIVFGISYFSWSIWHHRREKTLYTEIVIEYLLISLLGVSIVLGII